MKFDVKDENYGRKHNYEEDDEVHKKRFNCHFEGCKSSFKLKGNFLEHFNHFISEDKFTYKICGRKFELKKRLENHLLIHKN